MPDGPITRISVRHETIRVPRERASILLAACKRWHVMIMLRLRDLKTGLTTAGFAPSVVVHRKRPVWQSRAGHVEFTDSAALFE